jgi:peptidoglycan/xylan/chitin deacetylase (PgdA/CDA1 family)
MKRILVIAVVLVAGAVSAFLPWQRHQTVPVLILMYHKIEDVPGNTWCVSPADFEAQMKALSDRGYGTILPSDLVAHRRWDKPLPKRPLIITFDDGYRNVMTAAEPILKKYGFRGITYLVTRVIADDTADRQSFDGCECLVWPEVTEMKQRGTMTFGAHTHDHANLPSLTDPYPQIHRSYQELRKHLGAPSDSFCYPFGGINETIQTCVQRVGFTTAMTCEDRVASIGPGVDLLALPRLSVVSNWRP